MSRLSQFAKKSDLLKIKIQYGKKAYEFNLYDELAMDEDNINKGLKTHITSYAFLAMLHKKCIKAKQQLEAQRKQIYARKYEAFKDQKNESTGRPFSNDLVDLKIQKSPSYIKITDQMFEAIHQCEILEVCVRSFEDRKDIMQSLSANLRKENH